MKHNLTHYGIVLLVFVLSAGSYAVIPTGSFLELAVSAPGVGALFYALFQLMRDQAAYEKQLDIQAKQFQFSIGSASHMANVAFDKHATFCEQYISELQRTAQTLLSKGETEVALDHAGKLFQLRQDFAAWLTDEIDYELAEFEKDLRKLGAKAYFIERTAGQECYSEERSICIDTNFAEFQRILGHGGLLQATITERSAIEHLKQRVRGILRIKELADIREYLVRNAHAVMNGDPAQNTLVGTTENKRRR